MIRALRLTLLLGLLLPGCMAAGGAKPVLVHYMPWFVAKPFSTLWGWHWTMNHYDPDVVEASGERQIASQFHPLIGPYDSADPAVLEYHVLLMKLGGIDGVIVDWYGMDSYLDYGVLNQRTLALLNWTRRAGLKFSLCYEDRTIQQEITGGFIVSTGALAHAQATFLYAQTNFLTDPGYMRLGTKPLLLNFGPQYFKSSGQWASIFSVLATTNQPAFFTLDNRASGSMGAFSWPPMWLSSSTGGVLTPSALEGYLNTFQQKGATWPAYVSSAFPRFQDIYAQAGVGSSYGTLADSSGDTLRNTLARAMTNSSVLVQLVTWNDYGEGTVIEPTREFGWRDVGIVQELRRRHLDATFPHGTNELGLALRLYTLRRQHATNAILAAELDRTFTNIVAGNLSAARLQLGGLESRQPAVYAPSVSAGKLEFSVGGYLSGAGALVQVTSNLASPSWTSVTTSPGSTNTPRFSLPIGAQGPAAYYRVRNVGQ
jgi:hypothetical protein